MTLERRRSLLARVCRWMPAAVLLVSGAALAWVWLWREAPRQANVLDTGVVVGLSVILLLFWLFLLSPLRWRTRGGLFLALTALVALSIYLFRFRGVSGDLVPLFEWRFRPVASGRGEPNAGSAAPAALAVPSKAPHLDYPQFLGAERDGKVNGVKLARDWALAPPKLRWRIPVGEGWSAFAVAGGDAFTQEQSAGEELVTCYSLETGELRWRHADAARYQTGIGGIGPRATPTVAGDRVFSMGATGILNCLDRATGRALWSRNVVDENRGKVNEWGMADSPLVHGQLVIAITGGGKDRSLAAYHRETGELVWGAGKERGGYASPLLAVLAGQEQVVIFNQGSITGHRAADGRVLWRTPWPYSEPCPAQPLLLPEDRILISGGYGAGSALYRIKKTGSDDLEADRLWESKGLKSKFANMVHRDGAIYGLDDGILVSLDLASGARRWKAGRYGHGQIILVDDLLLLTSEWGEVVLLEANPSEHRELCRFQALTGKAWNCPAFAAPFLLVRNDREAACYELPMAGERPGLKE